MNSPKALALLRHLGVGPRAVARHLGIAEQTASNWSAGRHRMPARHEPAFLALLRETVQRAKAQRAQATASPLISPEAPPTSLLGLPALTGTPAVPYPPERPPVLSYFLRLSPVGRDSMRWNLARTAKLLSRDRCHDPMAIAWHQLTYSHMLALRAALLDHGYAPQTCERTLDGVRGVLKECWKLDWMRHEAYPRAIDIPRVKGKRLPAGRWVELADLEELFRHCAADPNRKVGARDAGLIAALYACGLRRMEAVNLDLGDYDADAGTTRVRRGQGTKDRLAYVHPQAAQALQARLKVRGQQFGPLLPCPAHGGPVRGKRLSYRVVWTIIERRVRQAGLKHCSPHDLRRSFVRGLFDAGVDMLTVQLLAGHSNITTAALYDRRPEQRQRAAVQLLTVPYSQPG